MLNSSKFLRTIIISRNKRKNCQTSQINKKHQNNKEFGKKEAKKSNQSCLQKNQLKNQPWTWMQSRKFKRFLKITLANPKNLLP